MRLYAHVGRRLCSLHNQRYALPWQGTTPRTFAACSSQWTQDSSKKSLRPYQEDSIVSALRLLDAGEKRLGISLGTGGGKTVIFTHLIDRVQPPTPDATQTLILAHRRELVEQAARQCRELYPDKTIDVEMGNRHASGIADITVASVPSLSAGDRLSKYVPERMKLVLADEVHHAVAPTWLKVLEHFRLTDDVDRGVTALVGVSATLSRADGLKLGTVIDHIAYHKDYVDLINDRYLSDVRFTTIETGVDLSRVVTRSGDGEFQTKSLSHAVNTPEANGIVVRSWMELSGERKSTLAFCVDLAHVSAITDLFRHYGYDARSITGNTRLADRKENLDAFKAGKFPVLVNCGIFTEGTDIPNIDCIVLARPTKSRNLLIQMVGRGLRNFEGKQDCHVLDMAANVVKGLATVPTLYGLSPSEVVKDASAADLEAMKAREDEKSPQSQATSSFRIASSAFDAKLTFTHYNTVNALIESTSGERHIRSMSRLAWVQVDTDRYILSDRSGSYLTLKLEADEFQVITTEKLIELSAKSKAPFMRPRLIAKSPTFDHALKAADTFAKKRFVFSLLLTSAKWRSNDASTQQLEFLNKWRDDATQLRPGQISKGTAGDWITKLKHGAVSRFKKIERERTKIEKDFAKAATAYEGVGPVRREGFVSRLRKKAKVS